MTARIEQRLERPDFTVVTVTGNVDAEQVSSQIESFLQDRPTRLVMWDIRNGSLADLSADDLRDIVKRGAPHAERRRDGRTAILCSKPVDFGLARMFQTLANIYHIPFEIEVFRDRAAALNWLFSAPGSRAASLSEQPRP